MCEAADCEITFEKRSYQHRFCSTACKLRERKRRDPEGHRARKLKSYRRDPSATKAAAMRSKEAKKAAVRALKEVPCADCGESHPYYVMDFDHVRGEKLAGVGAMLATGYSMQALLDEIDKCEVVCANCHRVRTFARLEED